MKINQKVAYRTMLSGVVLGKIVRESYYVPLMGDYVDVKVTSRKNPNYPLGLVYAVRADSSGLSAR
jgi:hypothetical protein